MRTTLCVKTRSELSLVIFRKFSTALLGSRCPSATSLERIFRSSNKPPLFPFDSLFRSPCLRSRLSIFTAKSARGGQRQ